MPIDANPSPNLALTLTLTLTMTLTLTLTLTLTTDPNQALLGGQSEQGAPAHVPPEPARLRHEDRRETSPYPKPQP